MDKAKIVAEGSPRQLIERVLDASEVTELRFPVGVQETLDGQLDGLGERIERLPDRVLVYSDDGEAAAAAAHQRGLVAGDGARPPALAGGRVPAPDRPQPRRLMAVAGRRRRAARAGDPAPTSRAQSGARAALARRVRAHVAALPADLARVDLRQLRRSRSCSCVAMGVGLGGVRGRRRAPTSIGGVPYLAVPRAGAAGVDRHAGLRVRGHVPGDRRLPLDPPLPRDVRDAADAVRDRVRAARLDRDPGDDGRRRSSPS